MPPPQALTLLWDCFSEVLNLRGARGRHKLLDILAIALCAVVCGGEDNTEIEEVGQIREAWLLQFLELPRGIASHDTFGRVLAALAPRAFGRCFMDWVRGLPS